MLDLVVFGATGFTGKFVVKHLLEVQEKRTLPLFKFGIAGRAKTKLRELTKELGHEEISTIVADVHHQKSLQEMVQQAHVLINCVGPYRLYGEAVIQACLEAGTHYVDITGEPEFMERMYEKYHGLAEKKNVMIVSACGFDSVPADLGVLYVQKALPPPYHLTKAESFLQIESGSKGTCIHSTTFESLVLSLSSTQDLQTLRKPKSTPPRQNSPAVQIRTWPYYEPRVQRYVLPFPGSDPSVVKRTQRYLKEKITDFQPASYGAYFTVSSWVYMVLTILFFMLLKVFSQFKLLRDWMIQHPEYISFGLFSKEGPTQEQLRGTTTKMTFYGEGFDEKHPTHQCHIEVQIKGPDPGYTLTSMTLVQAALTILAMENKRGGVLTPGAAFYGTDYIERLQKHGMNFKVLYIIEDTV